MIRGIVGSLQPLGVNESPELRGPETDSSWYDRAGWCRLPRLRWFGLVFCLAVACVCSASAQPSAITPADRQQITLAFEHVFGAGSSSAVAATWIEDGDARLAAALGRATQAFLAEFTQGAPRTSVQVRSVESAGAGRALVVFAIVVRYRSGSFTQRFSGAAVRTAAGWKVGWATACFLTEFRNVLCPSTPSAIARLPLPGATLPARFAHPVAAGLLRPTALAVAVARDGSLLIVDQYRDQVLRRDADGRLTVFAGDGRPGYSGDGGSASAASLDGPAGIAVAADGMVYLADTGNNRVRAISPDGTIRTVAGDGRAGDSGDGGPAIAAGLAYPTGVAVGPDGSLYISTDAAVRKVDPQGTITTFARGTGRFNSISVAGKRFAFSPEWLAVDGAGNVDVFSFSPKELVEFSPAGRPLRQWPNYANGIATAADGSVVIAEHGATVQRLKDGRLTKLVDLSKARIPGYNVPPTSPGGSFAPEGVAVGPDGTIYADTFVGDGWTNQTALAAITPNGKARLLRIFSAPTATLPALNTPGFPAALYPNARPTRSGASLSACPSVAGLRPFTRQARAAAVSEAKTLDVGFPSSLQLSDRAWWAGLYSDWSDGQYGLGRHKIAAVRPATGDIYAAAVRSSCASTLLDRSLAITVGPSAYSSQVSHLFFLNRDGHPLLYWQHT